MNTAFLKKEKMPKSYYLTLKKKEKTKKLSSHLPETNKKKEKTKKISSDNV